MINSNSVDPSSNILFDQYKVLKMIYSPMPPGNGAYVLHSILAGAIPNYAIQPVPVRKTLFPTLLKPYRKPADIVHTLPEFGDVFLNDQAKAVLTFHNYFWDRAYRPYCSLAQNLFYRLLQSKYVERSLLKADAIVAVSEFTAGLVQSSYPGVKVQVILNGVDTQRFYPREHKIDRSINILFSGNPSRRKGGHVLKTVADSLPKHARLIVTGGLRKGYSDLHHPNITFVGHVPFEDMPSLYRQADMLLLPSYREGLSLSALEAMASGLPVITYDSSSMGELIVNGRGGFLTPIDRVDDLVCAVLKCIEDHDLLVSMGCYNRQRAVAVFDQKKMISEYTSLFNTLL